MSNTCEIHGNKYWLETEVGKGYCIRCLQDRHKNSPNGDSSWENDVDRQGGAFTQDEINNSTAWR